MKKMYLLLNHSVTECQKQDARNLGVDHVVPLPEGLGRVWENLPADADRVNDLLTPIKQWLAENATEGDYVLIQGDFGATCIMVNFAFEKSLIPIYSTSPREALEEHRPDGSVKLVHNFKHRLFREYGR